MHLGELNRLDEQTAARELLRCCGSTEWAREMAASRPFDGPESLAQTSDTIWASLERPDWLEAFAAHPRIGDPGAGPENVDGAADIEWATREQSGVAGAPDDVLERLAAGNRAYRVRFGYIFIVCATGKSAEEMLTILDQRLTNDPDEELHIAAEEQRKITRLRLAKLLT
jgi:OHCU decarboxylase